MQRAWKATDAKQKEDCVLRAGQFGRLRNGDLRTLQIAQLQQGKSDEALATARRNLREYGGLAEKAYLCESLDDHGDYPEARGVLRGILSPPGQNYDKDPVIQTLILNVAVKVMAVTTWLDQHELTQPGQELFAQRGYHELYYPSDVPYQHTTVSVEGAQRYEDNTDKVGNRFLHIWPKDSGPVWVREIITQVPMRFDMRNADGGVYEIPNDVRPFLGKTINVDPTTKTVGDIAARARGRTRLQTVDNVLTYLSGALRYSADAHPEELRSLPLSEATLRAGYGLCSGYCTAVTAVLRRAGIAARTIGVMNGVEPLGGESVGGHAIEEFYEPSLRCWVPVEMGIRVGRVCRSFARVATENPDLDYDLGLRGFFCTYIAPQPNRPGNTTKKCLGLSLDEPSPEGTAVGVDGPGSITLEWDQAGQFARVVRRAVDPSLFSDAADGNLQAMQARLARTPSLVRATDPEFGATPLHYAALTGKAAMVAALIDAGAVVDARNNAAQTPLHNAAAAGADEVVRLLLTKGASASAGDAEGYAPHHFAVARHHPTTAAILTEADGPAPAPMR